MKPLAICLVCTIVVAFAAASPAKADRGATAVLPEAAAKLAALLRLDTSNPPGREEAAARLIAGWLKDEGITARLLQAAPGRVNLVARLPGPSAAVQRPLLLLNHLDVVPVEPKRWKVPPFSAWVADGTLWGRGALDMKGLAVMELIAFLELKRRHAPLSRDVIFCATADEEAGGTYGVRWLLANHPAEVACSELLNEGGMGMITPSGKPLLGIQTAERGTLWTRVTARGETGHASRERPDSAPRRLLRALARLETAPRAYEVGAETAAMLRAISHTESGLKAMVLTSLANNWLVPWLAPRVVAASPVLGPLLGTTINPTLLTAGQKVNVIPGEASAQIDVRLLPGHTTAETLQWLEGVLADPTQGDPALEWEVLHASEPSRSRPEGPLYDGLIAACQAEYPGVAITPILTPGGGTDSAYFRARGVNALGFMPILATQNQIDAMHGDNESIDLAQLAAGTRVVMRAVALAATR